MSSLAAKRGSDSITHAGAQWCHTACQAHRPDGGDGTGHDPSCAACQATAAETIAHIKAVEANG